jgi:hypothetical protein
VLSISGFLRIHPHGFLHIMEASGISIIQDLSWEYIGLLEILNQNDMN